MITDDVAPLRYDVEPWFMSGFDFRCIWEALGLDRLPMPLAYRIRDMKFQREVDEARRTALRRQRTELTPPRIAILEAVRFPAFLLQGFGQVEVAGTSWLYRLFGAIGANGYGAVITQDPSDELIFGEDVQIVGCVNVDFPQVVIEALPDFTPGSKPRREGRYEAQSPAEALASQKITSSILLSASTEYTLDYDLRDPHNVTLIDVADEGAYLVNEGVDTFQIVPASVSNLMEIFKKVEELQLRVVQRRESADTRRDSHGLS